MIRVQYVEIENFKTFQQKIRIDLGHPAVLIGPNNAGKTSVIQALSLWSRGIRGWYEKKGESAKEKRERVSSGINRLNILDVPVSETRFLWNATKVRVGNSPIEMKINLGLEHNGLTEDCRMIFTYRDAEVIYCRPCPDTLLKEELLKRAAQLQFHLLYPMSGIMAGVSAESEETPLPEGRINVYLGQGQTAQVLRNICYKVCEQDSAHSSKDWGRIAQLIERIFLVKLHAPVFNEARGSLIMRYSQTGTESDLDISLAGRGLQQVLLILAYLYWRKRSILLVDEPDAHLEILRQRQIYEILKHIARENDCQVVIATHSEVILDDAVDVNLTLLLYGQAQNLAKQQDMKHALKTFGIEHYYKARVHPRVLYLEGSSDVDMLRALAARLEHPAAQALLDDRLYCYYTRDISPEYTLEDNLARTSGAYADYRAHFHTLKKFVPELKGIAFFDSDGRIKPDEQGMDLMTCYWKNYELENYFISRDTLLSYARSHFGKDMPLFEGNFLRLFEETLDDCFLEEVFEGDRGLFQEFRQASPGLQTTLLRGHKMSALAEKVFKRFAENQGQPPLLTKGQFYQLVAHQPKQGIPEEIHDRLNLLVRYLTI